MNYLKQALTEYLSGLTTKKNDKEIWTKNKYGIPITIEPIDDENYIVRYYYENGSLNWMYRYKNDQPHGVCKAWSNDGLLSYELIYKDGVPVE